MNYELAKQLKDSGFLFTEWYLEKHNGIDSELKWDNKNWEYPTLHELIQACGKNINFKLIEEIDAKGYMACGAQLCDFGSTPEEAVAKLWLALNMDNRAES